MQIQTLPYTDYPPLTVAAKFAHRAGCVFLDSAAGGRIGRCSFLAAEPFAIVSGKGNTFSMAGRGQPCKVSREPWSLIAWLWQRYQLPLLPHLPPLQGGLIGYWGYELNQHVERLPRPRSDDLDMPDLWLGAYDWVLAWDHVAHTCQLIATGLPAATASEQRIAAQQRIEQVLHTLTADHRPVAWLAVTDRAPAAQTRVPLYEVPAWPGIRSTFTPLGYQRIVQQAIDYIHAGDVYQVNLSQRLEAPLPTDPWRVYTALRERNPADFAAFLHCGDTVIASASPERFLRLDERQVETRPIKGTAARSSDPHEDQRRAAALQASLKDRAENLMIVDLLRNDLGRVCEIGSVQVSELWTLEQHPTVYHLVSTVCGQLRPQWTPVDLLRTCFPGGSITGAPKIRAMEIIAELEPTARGAYCGAIGYLGWNGQLDTSITIRTMIMRGGRVFWQAGGGVVADSTPLGEYTETLAKARALSEVMLQPW